NNGAGIVFVYRFDTDKFVFDHAIKPDTTGLSKFDVSFGYNVDYDGTTLIVGAPTWPLVTPPTTAGGKVILYEFDTTEFVEVAGFLDPGLAQTAQLGASVSVRGDIAVVGMPGETSNQGAALILRRTGGTWAIDDRIHSQRPMK